MPQISHRPHAARRSSQALAVAGLIALALMGRSGAMLASTGALGFLTPASPQTVVQTSGTESMAVDVADFNHDGIPDLAALNQHGADMSILLGLAAGGYSPAVTYPIRAANTAGFVMGSLDIADLNRDGWDDIVVANNGSSTAVSVFLADGSHPGAFLPVAVVGVGENVVSATVADVNRDGIPDILAVHNQRDSISVLLGNGTGGFVRQAVRPIVGSVPFAVAAADFNGDGFVDLATANRGAGSVSVQFGDGTGAFVAGTQSTLPIAAGALTTAVATGDVNSDGATDIVAANYALGTATVFLGNGAGAFLAGVSTVVGATPFSVKIADMNRDGVPDLVTSLRTAAQVAVALGTGTGTFTAPVSLAVGASAGFLAVSDVNRDGLLDVVCPSGQPNAGSLIYVSLATPVAAPSTMTFDRSTVAVGVQPTSVAIGDMNRDGRLDLVASNFGGSSVSVASGLGNGSFGASSEFGVAAKPFTLALSDLNRDGRLDVVTANNGNVGHVSTLLGDGTGGLRPSTDYVGNASIFDAVGDFNRDGIPDVITADDGSARVSVRLGLAAGGLGAAATFAVSATPFGVAVADFNRDGKLDVATASLTTNKVTVLLGNGSGGFSTYNAASDVAVGALPRSIAAGDLNADGLADLVTTNATDNTLSILIGLGNGQFAAPVSLAAGCQLPRFVQIADLNRDGRQDLIVANGSSHTVSILLGTGNGAFAAPQTLTDTQHQPIVVSSPIGLALADLNRDGQLDVVVASSAATSTSLVVLLNTSVPPNLPPTATMLSIASQSPGTGCVATVRLDGSLSFDADLDPLKYLWTDNGVVIGAVNALTVTLGRGAHTVALTVDDLHGHVATTSSTFTVQDTTPPSFIPPASVSLEATSAAGAVFVPSNPVVSDNCDPTPTLTISPSFAGNVFPVGDTTLTYTATDHETPANTLAETIIVSVSAGRPPLIANHPDVVVEATSAAGAIGTYATPTAIDDFDGVVAVSCAPASGTQFALGLTTVTCSAADHLGYAATSQFRMQVRDTTAPVIAPALVPAPTGTFAPPIRLDMGVGAHESRDVKLADLDGDGFLDIIAAESGGPTVVSIRRGLGNGAFRPAELYELGRRGVASGIAIGDFNRDGRPDIAAATSIYEADDVTVTDAISVLLNQPGGFGPAASFRITDTTHLNYLDGVGVVVAADFIADPQSNLDLAVRVPTGVAIMQGRGDGTFALDNTLTTDNPPSFTPSVAVDDFNHDGRPDIATTRSYPDSAAIVWFNSATGFLPATAWVVAPMARVVVASDVNADGFADLVVLGPSMTGVVLLATGPGAFQASREFSIGLAQPWTATMGDINHDGKPDLVISDIQDYYVWVQIGDGAGGFSEPVPVNAGGWTEAAALSDVNRDGKLDIVVATGTSSASVLLNGFTADQTVSASGSELTPLVPAPSAVDMTPDGSGPMEMPVRVVGSTVFYTAPTAEDLVDGVLPVECSVPTGTDLPTGTMAITCWATDRSGNIGTVTFNVTVIDAPPPAVTPGHMRGDGFIKTGSGSGRDLDTSRFTFDVVEFVSGADRGRIAFWTGHDDDRARDARRRPHRHDLFVSTSIASAVFSDDPGFTSGRKRSPAVDTLVVRGTGEFNDVPGYTFEMRVTDAGEPGRKADTFTLVVFNAQGERVIDISDTIDGGNIQSLRLSNRTAPPIVTGGPTATIAREAVSADGAVVTYAAPTAVDNTGAALPVVCAPASGSTFDLGTTHVTCVATDAAGRSASVRFRVTVADHTAPVFAAAPANMTVNSPNGKAVRVSFTPPIARDVVDGAVVVRCSVASGSAFTVGATTVTCTATDDAGNVATTTFTVTVKDTRRAILEPAGRVAPARAP